MRLRYAATPSPVCANVKLLARQNKLACQRQKIFNLAGVKTVMGARCNGHGTLMRFAPLDPVSAGKNGHGARRGHGAKENGMFWSEQSIGQPFQTHIC